MAKVPPPKGKGEPPPASSAVGNLDKSESEALVSLNFKVPAAFRREYRLYSAAHDKNLVDILVESFALLKEHRD